MKKYCFLLEMILVMSCVWFTFALSANAAVTIRILDSVGSFSKANEQIAPLYTKQHPDVKVEFTLLPYEGVITKLKLEMSEGSSTYDIYAYDAYMSLSYLPFEQFLPLEKFLKDPNLPRMELESFIPGLVDSYGTWKGQTVAIPYYHANRVYAYRKDLFEDPGERMAFIMEYGYELEPPETWDEYRDIAEFFTRDSNGDGMTDFWGTTKGFSYGIAWDEFSDRYQSFKPPIGKRENSLNYWIDDKHNTLFNGEKGIKALQDMVDMANSGFYAPGYLERTWVDVIDPFCHNNAAMTDMFTDSLCYLEVPEYSEVVGKVGYYIIPRYEVHHTISSAFMYAVNKHSRNPVETFKFLQWITSAEVDKQTAMLPVDRRLPLRVETYKDPEVLQKMPVGKACVDSAPFNISWPLFPEFEELYTVLSTEIQKAIMGEKTPKAALDEAASHMRGVFKRAGYYD